MLCNLFKNKLISYIFGMFVMLVASMMMLYKLNARMLWGIGCPMYMVSGAIQRLTMDGVTSCDLCELLMYCVNCLFALQRTEKL